MSEVRCFWMEELLGKKRPSLRRSSVETCLGRGYHKSERVFLDDVVVSASNRWTEQSTWPREEPRWPKACWRCGRVFTDADNWECFLEVLYRRTDSGELLTTEQAPAGAMWDAWWWREGDASATADIEKLCLMVMTPGGEWMVDDPRKPWHRTGDPRHPETLTVRPSILIPGKYHGFLTAGVLVEC